MKKSVTKIVSGFVAVATIGALGLVASPAQADVAFEPEPCILTLADNYNANASGWLVTEISPSVFSCPDGFSVTTTNTAFNVSITGDSGNIASIAETSSSSYVPTENKIVENSYLALIAFGAGTYTGVNTSDQVIGGIQMYIKDEVNSKVYRVQLAKPFTVTATNSTTQTCQLNMPKKVKYSYGQRPYFVIPDSAMVCQGFTFSSAQDTFSGVFRGPKGNIAYLNTVTRKTANATATSYTTTRQLELTIPYPNTDEDQQPSNDGIFLGGLAFIKQLSQPGSIPFGKLSLDASTNSADEGLCSPKNVVYQGAAYANLYGGLLCLESGSANFVTHGVTLKAPFEIKAATDLAASMKKNGDRVQVSVQADRNLSVQSGDTPTYNRQKVIPNRAVDQPKIYLGKKLIATVKLTKFGKGSVSIPNQKGKQTYTVKMPETTDNFAGKTTFKA